VNETALFLAVAAAFLAGVLATIFAEAILAFVLLRAAAGQLAGRSHAGASGVSSASSEPGVVPRTPGAAGESAAPILWVPGGRR
jgi:hypothetical protein